VRFNQEEFTKTTRSVVVATIAAFGIIYYTNSQQTGSLHKYSDTQRDKVIQSQITSCEQVGNPLAAWEQHRARVVRRQDIRVLRQLIPIRDCFKTYKYNKGIIVPMTDSQQLQYVRLIEDCKVPVLRHGKLVVNRILYCPAE
jgi:hypothetical protein